MISAESSKLFVRALWLGGAAACVASAGVLGWIDQLRKLRTDPPMAAELDSFRLMPNGISGAPPETYFAAGEPYEGNSSSLSEGKRLYAWFGCTAFAARNFALVQGTTLIDAVAMFTHNELGIRSHSVSFSQKLEGAAFVDILSNRQPTGLLVVNFDHVTERFA